MKYKIWIASFIFALIPSWLNWFYLVGLASQPSKELMDARYCYSGTMVFVLFAAFGILATTGEK